MMIWQWSTNHTLPWTFLSRQVAYRVALSQGIYLVFFVCYWSPYFWYVYLKVDCKIQESSAAQFMNVAKFGIFSKFHQLCFLLPETAKGKLILNYPTPYERSNLSSWWWRSGRRITQSRIPINHQPSLFCRLLVWRLQVVNPKKCIIRVMLKEYLKKSQGPCSKPPF